MLATSGRAVEASGDVDTLLLDKTGTITYGNRMATEVIAGARRATTRHCGAALMASLADETPEGRSIVELARETRPQRAGPPEDAEAVVPFSATTRMSGLDVGGRQWRKGAVDAILRSSALTPNAAPAEVTAGGRPHRALRRHAAGRRPRTAGWWASST